MLAGNTDLFNPLVPKAHNVKIYYFLYKSSQQKSVKPRVCEFLFLAPSALMG